MFQSICDKDQIGDWQRFNNATNGSELCSVVVFGFSSVFAEHFIAPKSTAESEQRPHTNTENGFNHYSRTISCSPVQLKYLPKRKEQTPHSPERDILNMRVRQAGHCKSSPNICRILYELASSNYLSMCLSICVPISLWLRIPFLNEFSNYILSRKSARKNPAVYVKKTYTWMWNSLFTFWVKL